MTCLLVLFLIFTAALPISASETHSVDFYSDTYTIDRIYKSMRGPISGKLITISNDRKAELLWITGFEALAVSPEPERQLSQEYMCHSSLDFRDEYILENPKVFTKRMFTIAQGYSKIAFPEGFGIPVPSNEPLIMQTQAQNLNEEEKDFKLAHKITIDFVRDNDLKKQMKPLIRIAGSGMVLVGGDECYFNVQNPDKSVHGPGCNAGETAMKNGHTRRDRYGRKFTNHWLVKPGRQINRTLITRDLNIPYDTTAHFISVHLHPFAESLELIDLTAGQSVFKSHAANNKERIAIDRTEYLANKEGVPVYKDHEYELVSIYNNTSKADCDAMAVIYLYILDKNFNKLSFYNPDE